MMEGGRKMIAGNKQTKFKYKNIAESQSNKAFDKLLGML